MAGAEDDFTLVTGYPSLQEGEYRVIYDVRPDIRRRLSPPPQQRFRMPDVLLETIRRRLDEVLNESAGVGVEPESPMEGYNVFDSVRGTGYYEQVWSNNKYDLHFNYAQQYGHQLNIRRRNSTEADLPVFQTAVNAILDAIRQSIPPAAGGRRRRKTRKQRRRMSRRRVR